MSDVCPLTNSPSRRSRPHTARPSPTAPPARPRSMLSTRSCRMSRSAPGAERQAHGNLPLTRGRPRHEQARDVAARNHQQHDHHRQQHVQRRRGLVAERGQAAAGRGEHDALGAEPLGDSRYRRRCATTHRHGGARSAPPRSSMARCPCGTRANTFSHSTFSCGGHGFRVSPRCASWRSRRSESSTASSAAPRRRRPRIDTVVPKNAGAAMPTMVNGAPLMARVWPTASDAPARLRCQ